jgi:uncharacterized DUF497 family protein
VQQILIVHRSNEPIHHHSQCPGREEEEDGIREEGRRRRRERERKMREGKETEKIKLVTYCFNKYICGRNAGEDIRLVSVRGEVKRERENGYKESESTRRLTCLECRSINK